MYVVRFWSLLLLSVALTITQATSALSSNTHSVGINDGALLQCRKGLCSQGRKEYQQLLQHKFEQWRLYNSYHNNHRNSKPEGFSTLSFDMVHEFDQIFEKHMVARKPFKSKFAVAPVNMSTWQETDRCIDKIQREQSLTTSPTTGLQEFSLFDCEDVSTGAETGAETEAGNGTEAETEFLPVSRRSILSQQLRLPSLLTSNYPSRANASSASSISSSADALHRLVQYYPTAIRLQSGVPTPVQQCPSGAHMVLWGATLAASGEREGEGVGDEGSSSSSLPFSIKLRVFHEHLGDYFGAEVATATTTTIDDHQPATKSVLRGLGPSYRWSGFPRYDPDTAAAVDIKSFPKYSEVNLDSASEVLFIPRGLLVSMVLIPDNEERESGNGHHRGESNSNSNSDNGGRNSQMILYKHCLIDASNVIAAKEALATEALISPGAHQLLNAFNSPLFDMQMSRNPVELTLAQFRIGYYGGKKSISSNEDKDLDAETDANANANADTGISTGTAKKSEEASSSVVMDTTSATPAKPSGRNRRSRKGGTNNNGNGAGTDGSGSTASSAQASAAEASAAAKKARQGALRDWQESKKWSNMITALTLPVPTLPEPVLPTGRTSAKLTWSSPFRPNSKDLTRFGFNLTVCLLSPEEVAMSGTPGNTASEPVVLNAHPTTSTTTTTTTITTTTCTTHTLIRGTSQLSEFIDMKRSASVGIEVYRYAAVISGLQPASQYRYRMTLLYGNTESNPSGWSDKFGEGGVVSDGFSSSSSSSNGHSAAAASADVDNSHDEVGASTLSGGTEAGVSVEREGQTSPPYIITAPLSAPSLTLPGQQQLQPYAAERPVCTRYSYTSVQCILPPAADDGGMDLLGVHVYLRHPRLHELFHLADRQNNSHLPHDWTWHDALLMDTEYATLVKPTGTSTGSVSVQVTDLTAGTSVELTFAYFNALGSSAETPPSNIISMYHCNVNNQQQQQQVELPYKQRTYVYGIDYRRRMSDLSLLTAAVGGGEGAAVPGGPGVPGSLLKKPPPTQRTAADPLVLAVTVEGNNWFELDGEGQTLTMFLDSSSSSNSNSNTGHPPSTSTSTTSTISARVYKGWGFHYAPSCFTVAAQMVLPLSNPLSSSTTLSSHLHPNPNTNPNPHQHHLMDVGNELVEEHHSHYAGRIVLLYRGSVPFVVKALHVQALGAVGVVIVDNDSKPDRLSHTGSCKDYTQHCIAGASQPNKELIGLRDKSEPWLKVRIPMLFITSEMGRELLKLSHIDLTVNTDPRIMQLMEELQSEKEQEGTGGNNGKGEINSHQQEL